MQKNVHEKDKAVQYDLCELWIHIKWKDLNYLDYRYFQNCDESWYCIECCRIVLPFNSVSSKKNFLTYYTNADSNIWQICFALKSQKIVMTQKIILHLNIMIIYLTKISFCPCVFYDKNYDDLQNLLSYTKFFLT